MGGWQRVEHEASRSDVNWLPANALAGVAAGAAALTGTQAAALRLDEGATLRGMSQHETLINFSLHATTTRRVQEALGPAFVAAAWTEGQGLTDHGVQQMLQRMQRRISA